jgi:Trypsin-like peptidase domain/Tetratricopeptide Repeats-Sensor
VSVDADAQRLHDLRQALEAFDRTAVTRLVGAFIADIRTRPDPVDPGLGLDVLRLLQRKRRIRMVQDVAEALLAHGLADDVALRHRYALALADHDRVAAAESLLATLPPEVRATDPEVQGAIGRVHKQRYVTAGPAAGARRAEALRASVAVYEAAYRADPSGNFYHGINTAALLHRAAADGVDVPGHPGPAADAAGIAAAILAVVDGVTEPDRWQLASAAEACLALDRHDDALVWLARYVGSRADAFELGSTLRQFELVWRLTSGAEPGRRLLPMLRNRLLQAEGGALSVDPSEVTPESLSRFDEVARTLVARAGVDYERIYGLDHFHPIDWLRDALAACRSVALVEDGYEGMGTGFVLAGTALRPGWPARVLLTNAHVVPDAVDPADVVVTFRGLSDTRPDEAATVRPGPEILWHSPRHELDTCVLALPDDLSPQVAPLPVRTRFPRIGPDTRTRAYVIGHPMGIPEVRLSLHDSVLLDADDRYAWYRSPTQRGSSGSPVFDDHWRVIALHHGANDSVRGTAGGAGGANEGIRIDRLLAAVRGGAG